LLGLTEVTVGLAAVTTVAEAVAVTEVSATDVAVTVTVLGEGTVDGAVYTPLESMLPTPVSVVESDQVTFWQVGLDVILQPGLLTVAVNRKCSPVPTVALLGEMEMLIPVTMVSVALAVLVVSACAVALIVTVGAMVVVLLVVVVGIVAGAVYKPVASIVPQELAATPVAQVKAQVTAVLLLPVTKLLNSCVRLVITLAEVGEITMLTPVDVLPPPQPNAASAAARVSSVENFHRIPILPKFLNVRRRSQA
jgi:hypothetical protein